MGDEESRSALKRMWKITSGVFIVFFFKIELKRPYNKLVVIKDYESAFDAVTVESALNNTFPG